ncbi:MAG TPA: hypothetical protein VHD90_17635 [Phototrophicaceae bacterium]|nr:hypothetical protein [Phototrophicaceae bacterium]
MPDSLLMTHVPEGGSIRTSRPRYRLWLLVAVLLLAAGSRAFLLDGGVTEVSPDEVWSVWQSLGTPQQIIQWTPYDWPPGYYLTIGAWHALVGINPIALRWLSLLAFMIGCAVVSRIARRLRGDGVIAVLVYSAFAYLTFMSTEIRGYALLFACFPLAIWLALRYFAHPKWLRALPLALTLIVMVYISFTSAAAWGALILFTLILYPRSIWRWWLPGLITILVTLPLIISKAALVIGRGAALAIPLPPLLPALADLYGAWSGNNTLTLWIALAALAGVLLIAQERRRMALGVLIWSLLPIPLYLVNAKLGFFSARYGWWVLPGIVLLYGVGLRPLPKLGRAAVALVFAGLALLPTILHSQANPVSFGTAFGWLAQHAHNGDVVLIDPRCGCGDPDVFDYYTKVYFPNGGLTYVAQAGTARRIWYVTGASRPDPTTLASVEQGRVAGIFVGPPTRLFRLYEAPPDPAGTAFANGMRFEGVERLDLTDPPVYHEGDPINLRLWWAADSIPKLDYSVGLYVFDDQGNLVAQNDSAPQTTPQATSQWLPGQFYSEQRTLQLPYPLPDGVYHLRMAVYWFGDQQRISAPGADANTMLPLLDFTVIAWGH